MDITAATTGTASSTGMAVTTGTAAITGATGTTAVAIITRGTVTTDTGTGIDTRRKGRVELAAVPMKPDPGRRAVAS